MHTRRQPDSRRCAFISNQPGQPLSLGGIGIELYLKNIALSKCALYLQKHGARYLMALSVGTVESSLTKFVIENYHLLASETLGGSSVGSYADNISSELTVAFAKALAVSSFFVEPKLTAVFPLVPITVGEAFGSPSFFLCPPGGLITQLSDVASVIDIDQGFFPPLDTWTGRQEIPSCWLGARAPTLEVAKQVRAAVLGAMALLPHHSERYLFSGRKMFGGYITFSDRSSVSFADAHTPPLMTDLVIGASDRPWLEELGRKLGSPRKEDQKHLRALQYFYRAWAPDPVAQFPTMFAAIDAIFGDAAQATQAVVDAVGPVMGQEYTSERIRLMLGLRASVVHGGAPNLYESSKYQVYYRDYGTDAVLDMQLIVARCLQQVIFKGMLTERPHTHAEAILRETGGRV